MVNLVISEQELWKVKSNKSSEGNNKEEITFRNEAYLLFLLFLWVSVKAELKSMLGQKGIEREKNLI